MSEVLSPRQRRASMPNLNGEIHRAIIEHPGWLASVYARLKGYPDPDQCWIWTGARHERGYGRVRLPRAVGGNVAAVHRIVWIAHRGPIWNGYVLDHDGPGGCRNRACANPAHVQHVPELTNVHTGNSQWGVNSRKTHCPRGHALVAENLIPSSLKRGQRECRICAKYRAQMRRELA